jgi:hypothetical protein
MGYKREHGLTVKQENALDLLVQGETDAAVAEVVGVNRVTVTKWRNYDAHFQAELNIRRKQVWGTSVDRLRSLLPRALDVLEAELDHGKQRGRTALEILRMAGLDRSGPKHSSLESYGIGATDPAVILDGIARNRRPDPVDELIHGEPVSEGELQSVLDDLNRHLTSDS